MSQTVQEELATTSARFYRGGPGEPAAGLSGAFTVFVIDLGLYKVALFDDGTIGKTPTAGCL